MNAIRLALLQEQLEGVAELMGQALARSAFSPNIRVRLDFSCALFTPQGDLLAQAAHIPVHLGSMPDQIKSLLDTFYLSPGDLFIANDPYNGGTHLPDITLIAPVFSERDELLGVTAARAHHADIGGATPGSMASQANIYGDGLRIPILKLGTQDVWNEPLLKLLLANMRSPGDRQGDLLAQQAACRQGALGLERIFGQWAGNQLDTWTEGISELLLSAHKGATSLLGQLLPTGVEAQFEDSLELGPHKATIKVRLEVPARGKILADFQGTSGGVPAGFNATLPVTKAAVCYVVRCLVPPELPLNQGFLDCIEVRAESGSLVSAVYPQAVAAGNVETSQRIVDAVFGAFAQLLPDRIPAASAGSMNNLSFGFVDPRFGVHYETAGGGAGALPNQQVKAQSGVQVHMTNTLATPVEVLEEEFPIIVDRHAFRPNSGGSGQCHGGDGTSKELTFLEPAEVSIMATRRTSAPYGLKGGSPGQTGQQALRELHGEWRAVDGSTTASVKRGDSLRLETPGGGGWGEI